MTKPMDLHEGWYWAKPTVDDIAQGWGFVYVGGVAPFLTVTPAIANANSPSWQFSGQYYKGELPRITWEFGPRIEFMIETSA